MYQHTQEMFSQVEVCGKLDEMSRDGWELVSFFPTIALHKITQQQTPVFICILRRPAKQLVEVNGVG